jgi:hypothetical protein
MGLGGWAIGKICLAVFSGTMYVGAIVTTFVAPPVAPVLWNVANASGAMLVSPIDPVSTTTAVVTTTL